MHSNKNGFTLAEVLITLAVIGVVAAMSIPSLLSNTNNETYAKALAKAYSVLTQGFQKYAAENSSPYNLRSTGLFEGDATYTKIAEDIPKIFNVTKVCGTTTGGGCFYSDDSTITDYKYLSVSGGEDISNSGRYKFTLADGMSIAIFDYDDNCNYFSESDGYSTESRMTNNTCGGINIDINGPKPPNVKGRDLFDFYVINDGSLIPQGSLERYELDNNSEYYWRTATNGCEPGDGTSNGGRCTARIIEEGWKMTY